MSTAMSTEQQRYLSYRGAAQYVGRSEMWLRRHVEAGHLKAYRPGGGRAVLIDRLELDEFIRGTSASDQAAGAAANG